MRKNWKIENQIPSMTSIRNYRQKLESFFTLKKIGLGVYNDYIPKLRSILIPLIRGKKLFFFENDETIKIKLCGDGVNVGNKLIY